MADPNVYGALLREIPTLDAIQATADLAHADPATANAAILRGYVTLSDAFGRLLHGTHEYPENATFPTFAAWAAASLRPEVVPSGDPARSAGVVGPARRAFHWVAREVLDIEAEIARNIVRGQGAIFEEIGSTIYKMLRIVLEGLGAADDGREVGRDTWHALWDEYARALGEMPHYLNPARDAREVLDHADVAMLQRAVLPYFEVLMDGLSRPDIDAVARKRRAELILVANVRILAYEQRRLQPLFQRNFAYVPDAVHDRVRALLGRGVGDRRVVQRTASASRSASALFAEAFQIAATRNVYSMVVGSETVRFGRDLRRPPPARERMRPRSPEPDRARYALGAFFPDALENLELGVTWAEWQRHDRSLGQGQRTAMDNWLRYGERMSFLANLFRSRQQLRALYDVPAPVPSALPEAEPQPSAPVEGGARTTRFSTPSRVPVPSASFLPDDVLDQLAGRGDKPADELLLAVLERAGRGDPDLDWNRRRAAFPDVLRTIAQEDDSLVSGFLAAGEEIDEHIDPELVAHAQAFFEDHGVAIITTLFHASLPEAYLARRGVQVLDLTGELVSNWSQRISETGQFLVNVLSPSRDREGADAMTLAHGQHAARVARRVRLRHAAVRWLLDAPYRPELPLLALDGIAEPAPWKVRMAQVHEDRVPSTPLNQEDLLGTLGTFTTVTFLALEKLAIAFDDDDRRAFHHLWNIVGWHLGIGEAASCAGIPVGDRPTWPGNAVLPLEVDEIDDLTVRLGDRLLGRTEEGARLAKTLVQELAYPLPAFARGAPDFLVRYMIGDEHGDLLELGGGGYLQLLLRRSGALEDVARLARGTPLGKHVIPGISQAVTRYALRLFIAQSRSIHSGLSIEPRVANLWGVPTGSEVRPRPQ